MLSDSKPLANTSTPEFCLYKLRDKKDVLERQLLSIYERRGRPCDGLDVKTINLIVFAQFNGSDCCELVYDKGTPFIHNGQTEIEVMEKLPEGHKWGLRFDETLGKAVLFDSTSKRLKSIVIKCEDLLPPVVNLTQEPRDLLKSQLVQSIIPESWLNLGSSEVTRPCGVLQISIGTILISANLCCCFPFVCGPLFWSTLS